jgi:hypothetical protein
LIIEIFCLFLKSKKIGNNREIERKKEVVRGREVGCWEKEIV